MNINISGEHEAAYARGSSPRARGKRCKLRQLKQQIRIIPARAGQTCHASRQPPPSPDHPRACGANQGAPADPVSRSGSSPRVRGKRCAIGHQITNMRIIPARAGQTRHGTARPRRPTDHPRACGANDARHDRASSIVGSSPRVRGKRGGGGQFRGTGRIIPARAGQTSSVSAALIPRPDHPRACGANSIVGGYGNSGRGSSPRVRGKLVFVEDAQIPLRIIPARAGQTASVERRGRGQTDHPRACGANRRRSPLLSEMYGSSPRVRGKLSGGYFQDERCRIIPARAGQTT